MSTDTIDPAKYPLTLQAKPFPLGKRSAYEGELFAIYEEWPHDPRSQRQRTAVRVRRDVPRNGALRRLLEFAAACNAEIAARSAAENSARAER